MTLTKTVPKSIKADGKTDVSDDLNEWFASLPNRVAFDASLGRKHFCCEKTIELDNPQNIRIRDGGIFALTEGPDGHRAHWRIKGGSNIKFLNILTESIRKPLSASMNWDTQWQHGIDFQGTEGYDLAACTIKGVLGDGVCNEYLNGRWTTDGVIRSTCSFIGTGRQTISFTAAKRIFVNACKVQDPTLSIIDIEPNGAGWGAQDITISGLLISNTNPIHTYTLLFISDYVAGGTVSDISVTKCLEEGNGVVCVIQPKSPNRYKNITFADNRTDFLETGYSKINGVDNLIFNNNMIPANQINNNP